jgi:hypothetical protein
MFLKQSNDRLRALREAVTLRGVRAVPKLTLLFPRQRLNVLGPEALPQVAILHDATVSLGSIVSRSEWLD